MKGGQQTSVEAFSRTRRTSQFIIHIVTKFLTIKVDFWLIAFTGLAKQHHWKGISPFIIPKAAHSLSDMVRTEPPSQNRRLFNPLAFPPCDPPPILRPEQQKCNPKMCSEELQGASLWWGGCLGLLNCLLVTTSKDRSVQGDQVSSICMLAESHRRWGWPQAWPVCQWRKAQTDEEVERRLVGCIMSNRQDQ